MMFALWSSLNHIPIKCRGPLQKISHLRPIYRSHHKSSLPSLAWDQVDIVFIYEVINAIFSASHMHKAMPHPTHYGASIVLCTFEP